MPVVFATNMVRNRPKKFVSSNNFVLTSKWEFQKDIL